MIIVGINAYHGDSAACILIDGVLVAAAEEERFKRTKHWAGFPEEAIKYCLEEAKVKISDVEHVAINRDTRANFLRKVRFTILNRPNTRYVFDRLKNKHKINSIKEELERVFNAERVSVKIHNIEHHLSHLASAHFASTFDKSICVSVDGFGDFSSGAVGLGTENNIEIKQRIIFPHSLGIFYQALTQYLGFMNYGDEYKVMGLAPYGKPIFRDEICKVVHGGEDGTFKLDLSYFRHHRENINCEWSSGVPYIGELFDPDSLETLLGFPRRGESQPLENHHRDLASSIQYIYEKVFFNILNYAYNTYKIDSLTLAGGCAMNSVANGKIYKNTPFKNVYIPSAAGDAGGAIGAAYTVANKLGENRKRFSMDHAYLGPMFDNSYHEKLLVSKTVEIENEGCTLEKFDSDNELCNRTAHAIAEGLVIGWFQGRMEWGPRALGNRSILGDPRRSNMKDILNIKIKRRESFRPFAPSILREKVCDWFEQDDDVPFMMQVFQVHENKRAEIPAVTHVDGSGRLHTVISETNPIFYKLISSFESITNVPILLNTSFNENEPVVCKPEEALATFIRTKMDVLVLGNWFLRRNSVVG